MKTQINKEKMGMVLIFLCLGVIISPLCGQHPAKQSSPSSNDKVVGVKPAVPLIQTENSGGQSTTTEPEGIPGDAFLNPGWQQGVVIMRDGNVIEIENLKYNLLTQQMHFVKNGEILAIANSEEIKVIRIADQVFVFEHFICKGILNQGYLELIEDGNCRLLRRWAASYRKIDPATDEEVIYRTQTCLIQFGGETPKEVHPQSKNFADSFGDYSQDIKRLIRNEKLKMRNPQDLRAVVAYYNQVSKNED
ncbi:MAG: hypothetical protein IH598_06605 [Bacteroidales bacterium]|nr:hypothetical protein [Bacteroidales bacterium]